MSEKLYLVSRVTELPAVSTHNLDLLQCKLLGVQRFKLVSGIFLPRYKGSHGVRSERKETERRIRW